MLYNSNDTSSHCRALLTPPLRSPGETRKLFRFSDEDECDILEDLTGQHYQSTIIRREEMFTNQSNGTVDSPFDQSTFQRSKSCPESSNWSSLCAIDNEQSNNLEELIIQETLSRKVHQPKLHEFLRLLLNNDLYVSYASWLNKDQGLFKIHKPTEVARIWGRIKARKKAGSLDYDTFSRSIRYYYYKPGMMIKTNMPYTYRFAHV